MDFQVPGWSLCVSHCVSESDNDQGGRQPRQSSQVQWEGFAQPNFSLSSFKHEYLDMKSFRRKLLQEIPTPRLSESQAIPAVPHWETLSLLAWAPQAAGVPPGGRGRWAGAMKTDSETPLEEKTSEPSLCHQQVTSDPKKATAGGAASN